ncbi:hypothetical protein FNV43_RR25090 [Rhamnella rubrinervis]|uniref:LRAT domain-containing protein n=1 Tax=Rhamnella rubrinervis TaxID=2594499 RepID=A0A8K0DZD1_9ROSA|nr:hypothetical protein FNV43_RR25090 [Rhamnella rubrinervis]
MGVLLNKIQKGQLKIGDHIYSWRRAYIYAHHGIYVGDEKVIHFTQAARQETGKRNVFDDLIFNSCTFPGLHCPTCGDQSKLDGVISSCLDCFLSGRDLYRFEYGVDIYTFLAETPGGTCTRAFADPPEQVVHRASFLLENGGFGTYNLFKRNCIDFAIYCKTGFLEDAKFSVRRCVQVASSLLGGTRAFIFSKAKRYTYVKPICGGLYDVSRLLSDVGFRHDATRIAVEDLVNGER